MAAFLYQSPCVLYPKSAQLPSGRLVMGFEDDESARRRPDHADLQERRLRRHLAEAHGPQGAGRQSTEYRLTAYRYEAA